MKKIILPLLLIVLGSLAVSAQGFYIEFKMTGQNGVSGTTKSYSLNGNIRTEIDMSGNKSPGGFKWVSISLKDQPQKSYSINEAAKTYSEIDLSVVTKRDSDPSQYVVTVIGKEKVNGYNCTHIKVKKGQSPNLEDLWVSTEVVNYKLYATIKSKYTSEGLLKAMEAKGVSGFPVRTVAIDHGQSIQIDLVKAEPRTNPASLFSLAGYTKAGAPGGVSGSSQQAQDAMKKIQTMTPEERQKFIEQLRKQSPPTPQN
jgi:hypothetical protein